MANQYGWQARQNTIRLYEHSFGRGMCLYVTKEGFKLVDAATDVIIIDATNLKQTSSFKLNEHIYNRETRNPLQFDAIIDRIETENQIADGERALQQRLTEELESD